MSLRAKPRSPGRTLLRARARLTQRRGHRRHRLIGHLGRHAGALYRGALICGRWPDSDGRILLRLRLRSRYHERAR
eukprot:2134683-Pyramimonas_sp.AAC.1